MACHAEHFAVLQSDQHLRCPWRNDGEWLMSIAACLVGNRWQCACAFQLALYRSILDLDLRLDGLHWLYHWSEYTQVEPTAQHLVE